MKHSWKFILLIIPIILFYTSFKVIKVRDKDWYSSGYDPSYAYLYNSLNMADLKLVGHVDHPGTTMQVIGGVILRAVWLVHPSGGNTLKEAVISQPEYYLRILNISVAILGALFILLIGLVVHRFTNNFWFSLIIQSAPFISGAVLFNGFTRISQESVLMIASISMSVMALHWYFNKNKQTNFYSWGFAIISGFGLASKIIFAPLMLIPLLVIEHKKYKIRYVLLSVGFFILFTLPIIPLYPHMANWFLNLFIHSGIYGAGATSVIDSSNYLKSLKELLLAEHFYLLVYTLTLVIICTLLFLKLLKKNLNKKLLLLLLAIFLTQTFGFVLVAKHPKVAYLLPYECLTAAQIILILNFITAGIIHVKLRIVLTGIMSVLTTVSLIYYGLNAREQLYSDAKNQQNEEAWRLATENKDIPVIGVSPGPSPISASFFGNAYSLNRYKENLQSKYPYHFTYDSYNKVLINWKREVFTLDKLIEHYGSARIITDQWLVEAVKTGLKGSSPTITFETIFSESVVVLEASLSEDNSTSDIVATDENSPYALPFEYKDVKEGDRIIAEVYAKGDLKNALLVFSAKDSREFYQTFPFSTDGLSGWVKITGQITVNKKISNNTMKIYCMNTGSNKVYFKNLKTERL